MDTEREIEPDRGRKTGRFDEGQPSSVYSLINKASTQVLAGTGGVCVCVRARVRVCVGRGLQRYTRVFSCSVCDLLFDALKKKKR